MSFPADQLIPLQSRIIVQTLRTVKKVGDVLLPETAKMEDFKQGTVISTGEGRYSFNGSIIPCSVKPGDRVLFGNRTGMKLSSSSDSDYYMLGDEAILAKFKE
ncbi:GroES chaperonin family like protein [Aduncisulcus paluster]|uniref:GroES chaperonin family like protein n=1 Tax=Aduncisulcus paluster TaxID=2918883 RepID=A0ABQ5KS84_9EUKA|nr:GroES chaperonin family like protein [Aduncisulcus paluster]|eukprot:gnl/Carplike_NY0171/1299_a1761_1029.p1 GENE.gnl/Carplike_NY0171/1299_a1761_1029~~gnl/Carplike_NY0171/1299_a1761_1029.p1  ORF type:complete len:103 (+),score=24.69 gnl/Carplike_NY0171/1299_a1761_1029:71-379(+)